MNRRKLNFPRSNELDRNNQEVINSLTPEQLSLLRGLLQLSPRAEIRFIIEELRDKGIDLTYKLDHQKED